ncbi:MAG: hypothetical protein ACRCZI_08400 [Cetobacterium sp.]
MKLAKMVNYNKHELKIVEIFWDTAYNDSWFHLSSEIIHDYLGCEKNNVSIRNFHDTMKKYLCNGSDYHEVVNLNICSNTNKDINCDENISYIINFETLKALSFLSDNPIGRKNRRHFEKVSHLCLLMGRSLTIKAKYDYQNIIET